MKELIKKFKLHQLGALCYLVWGSYFLFISRMIYHSSQSIDQELVQSRVHQDAFFLFGFAISVITFALIFNLRNRKMGWILNGFLAGFVELSVIVTSLKSIGFLAFFPGFLLYLGGVLFTSCGILFTRKNTS